MLLAADADRDVDDAQLAAALDEMLADGERLTRVLLGSAPTSPELEPPGSHGGWSMFNG